jgi:hypothetical protein
MLSDVPMNGLVGLGADGTSKQGVSDLEASLRATSLERGDLDG